ncbi:putative membrane protein [uncultured Candidatus Thioglobus sp.]|nr:putative membrane protein [uncultured Candidatus Thioglobus sp.]
MLDKMDNCPYTLLIGRVLLVLIYFIGGLGLLSGQIPIDFAASKGIPEFMVWIGFAIKLFAGLAVIVGYQTRIAALALVVFTLVTAFVFHEFGDNTFMKEISMIGGLLILAATGAGKFSFDGK